MQLSKIKNQKNDKKMAKKLKTLKNIVFENGPIYKKLQICLEEWKVAYKKRNMKGDDCVAKFIEHFGEIKL